MKEETKNFICNSFSIAVTVLVFAAGIVATLPKYKQYRALQDKIAARDGAIAKTEADIASLEDKVRRFAVDRDFVEAVARQNRRVYPGELVFVFPECTRR